MHCRDCFRYQIIDSCNTMTHAPSSTPVTFPVNGRNDVIAIDETRAARPISRCVYHHSYRYSTQAASLRYVQAARRSRSGELVPLTATCRQPGHQAPTPTTTSQRGRPGDGTLGMWIR